MRVEGARELAHDMQQKADRRIDGEVMRDLWETADAGAAIAAELAPKDTRELADSIVAGTYSIPGGARGVWGPTAAHGRHVEEGTAHTPPRPYLSPSLDRVEPEAMRKLTETAATL